MAFSCFLISSLNCGGRLRNFNAPRAFFFHVFFTSDYAARNDWAHISVHFTFLQLMEQSLGPKHVLVEHALHITISHRDANGGSVSIQSLNAGEMLGNCSCHLRLNACNRSLFARGLSIDFPAYVISHHVRWPIRAPPLITPNRPKANSNDTAAWHA